MSAEYYSLRMRSSQEGTHLSGAERLVESSRLNEASIELLQRGLEHSRGRADALRLAVDLVAAEKILKVRLPDVSTWVVDDVVTGRRAAVTMLVKAGVNAVAAEKGVETLAVGASPAGSSMRGAVLMDATSGRRLEPDPARGVRASRMDLADSLRAALSQRLEPFGLDNSHVREALVLAAKVITAPGIVAELCWSDDPDYVAGYVASSDLGYVRFSQMKLAGDTRGGRVFFVAPGKVELATLIDYLEQAPVLATEPGTCHSSRTWSERA